MEAKLNEELKNILSNSNKDIDNQKLMDYISQKGSDEDRHEIEKKILESDFIADAVEGLETISDKSAVTDITNTINREFKKQLSKKKIKRSKTFLAGPYILVYAAIILILLIIIICYLVISRHLVY